ncbi:MAG: polysaccharide biosynthesis C-terminal domain-containing protein, partial [Clostridia bacterium]
IFVVMLLGATPEIMAAGSTLATTVAASSAFLYLLKYYNKNKKDIWKEIKESPKFKLDSKKKIVKKLISYVIPISFGSIVVALSGVIDIVTVMDGLQKMGMGLKDANEQFGILLGKVDILNAVPLSINVAFSVALVPFISGALARHRKNEAINKINYSLKISSCIAFPCAAGLFVLAGPIFQLIFPNASQGAGLLQIQCWTIIFAVLAQTLSGSLQGFGKLYVPGVCLAIGAIVKYFINVIFVPKYGIIVPAISTVIYNAISCILAFIILFKVIKKKPNILEILIKPALATLVMAIVVFLTYKGLILFNISNNVATIISLFVAVFIYVVALFAFNILKKDEILQLPFGTKIYNFVRIFKKMQ